MLTTSDFSSISDADFEIPSVDIAKPADGSEGLSMLLAYSAMKAALNMVVAKFSMELQPKDIKTLALCPGAVATSTNPRKRISLTRDCHSVSMAVGLTD